MKRRAYIPSPRRLRKHAAPTPREPAALQLAMNYCHACSAANPTRPGEPHPAKCTACGTAMKAPPSWAGKTVPRIYQLRSFGG